MVDGVAEDALFADTFFKLKGRTFATCDVFLLDTLVGVLASEVSGILEGGLLLDDDELGPSPPLSEVIELLQLSLPLMGDVAPCLPC